MNAPNSDHQDEEILNEGEENAAWNDEPEFLDSNDVVEVATLYPEDEMPVEDDEEDAIEEEDPLYDSMEEPPSPELCLTISAHSGPVYSCSVVADTPTSWIVASGGGDDAAYWTRVDGEYSTPTTVTQKLTYSYSDSVCAVAMGRLTQHPAQPLLLAVGGYDGIIVLYDGATGACLMDISSREEEYKSSFVGPTDVEWLSFHGTGTVLLAGSSTDGTVWMYHVEVPSSSANSFYTLNCMQVLVGHAALVAAGGFTADGRWAVTIGNSGTRDDATCRIWNPKTGLARHTLHLHSGSTTGTLPNDDGEDDMVAGLTCLALGLADDEATSNTTPATTNAASSSSKLVLAGSEDGWAYVCHVGTGKVLHALRHASDALVITNNNSMETDEDDAANMEPLLSVEAVGFCPSNPLWCATAGADGILKIWDLANGQCRHLCRVELAHPTDINRKSAGITRLCWLPPVGSDATRAIVPPIVAVATTDGRVHVWDARNGALLQTLRTGGVATINDLQIVSTPDQHAMIVTASEDHAVRLFHLNVTALLQPKPPSL
jgi:WD40 repeat protein